MSFSQSFMSKNREVEKKCYLKKEILFHFNQHSLSATIKSHLKVCRECSALKDEIDSANVRLDFYIPVTLPTLDQKEEFFQELSLVMKNLKIENQQRSKDIFFNHFVFQYFKRKIFDYSRLVLFILKAAMIHWWFPVSLIALLITKKFLH